ncbi:hypothetical protein KL86DPRO_20234 [uncultured delta proteobacterium]|uniref:Uncharacterized protein n=1 Tax=uncultured delta proteobacterium TaxID=34034 RepID=A0A212JWY1_9DELT|nr:hypothetical protein KL86DPRO_20234 [uncultured delta proteobacterium]
MTLSVKHENEKSAPVRTHSRGALVGASDVFS